MHSVGVRASSAYARRVEAAAAVVAVVALATGAIVFFSGPLATGTIGSAGIGFGIYIDRLNAVMFALVAFVGYIVLRYARTYMEGDARHAQFTSLLAATLGGVLLLAISGNALPFLLAWIAFGVGLERLIIFYPERRIALVGRVKYALTSRISEVSLLAAFVIIYSVFHTLDIATLVRVVPSGPSPATDAAAFLLIVAACLKSAQFPTHGWLTEVMETPTPVSALLHAGIVNAGGFLILRYCALVSHSTVSMELLAAIGAVTAIFGSVVMLTQTSVKVALAFSTVAQMGFMMLECGLGAFSAALLHIVAHSLYKAHAFLSSGSVIDIFRMSYTPSPGGRPHKARVAIAAVAVLAITSIAGRVFAATPFEQPGVFALAAVLLLGVSHLLANALDEHPNAYVVARASVAAAGVAVLYFGLQTIAHAAFASALPSYYQPHAPFAYAVEALVIVAFTIVTIAQGRVPGDGERVRTPAIYALVRNGLYVNTFINRFMLASLAKWNVRERETTS